MTYLVLCVLFLGVATGLAAVVRWATGRRTPWRRTALAAAVLLLLTAVFDNAMIAAGLFAYSDAHISGLRVGLAPVEDFAYPVAAVVLLPALWSLLGGDDDH
ncbi:lycopene cyclase domain-containing protein [Myceligenerans salitolerans]|uniref:Lycopene cyclase domain-containing protein n=1 Tax=Myceligenerans salitolerans TaxID=1230528 RepID=A0ABS3I484_9MICO|nr:lycopene cyclase domain-containing protein [Myceligenerans salitolerans]MBO0607815.1 lycopene cyclase domain-containing protein [Myceligenerans salitolerans]